MAQKNYVGSGKEFTFNDGGKLLNISIKKEDLEKCKLSPKGYYFLTVSERKEADKFGNTHSVYENTYEKKSESSSDEDELLS